MYIVLKFGKWFSDYPNLHPDYTIVILIIVQKLIRFLKFTNLLFSLLELKDTIALTGVSKARAVCLPEFGVVKSYISGCH